MELRYGPLCAGGSRAEGAKERCGLLNPANKRLCHDSRRKLRVERRPPRRIRQMHCPCTSCQPACRSRAYYVQASRRSPACSTSASG